MSGAPLHAMQNGTGSTSIVGDWLLMPSKSTQARWLALSLHSGDWTPLAIKERLQRALPAGTIELSELTSSILAQFGTLATPAVDVLAAFLVEEPLLQSTFKQQAANRLLLDPTPAASQQTPLITPPLAALSTRKALCAWLAITDNELTWFADCTSRQTAVTVDKLHHYRYLWLTKPHHRLRLIESPKPRLKTIQRKILREILGKVPIHAQAHGFCQNRSIKTFAAVHTGHEALLKLDLQDFFHSVPNARIGAVFRRLGYEPEIAWLLQNLCTHASSEQLAGAPFKTLAWAQRKRLQAKHLPQGAPTSPTLSNLCAWRLDCRLQGFAARLGLNYTRYADDLAFSGPRSLAKRMDRIVAHVGAIAIEEGFQLNYHKIRLRLRAQRQHLTGLAVNQKINYPRAQWDQLKATLYNCARDGPARQNRLGLSDFKAHLQGRIAHVDWVNPQRAKKLWRLWEQINWD